MTKTMLDTPQTIHLIGIGGAGMAAIAEVLHGSGHTVTGSDLTASAAFERLVAMGVGAVVGHDPLNLGNPDIVCRSTSIPDTNVEVLEYEGRGGTVLRRGELLTAMTSASRTVAVAGTHGKTTTSSMLAVIAEKAGAEPTYIIGGDVKDLGSGATAGSGEWFIIEADESDGSGFALGHTIGVVTNVEPDHLEFYGSEQAMRDAFAAFVAESDVAVVCADDEGAFALAQGSNAVTYGAREGSTYEMRDIVRSEEATTFALHRGGLPLGQLRVPMPGLHNARNATAAAAAALEMGLPFRSIQSALGGFSGVGRRFDDRGTLNGIDFIDDYAHLPTEVNAALSAAVDTRHDRIVTIFQPHRYSRTQALWQDFTGCFTEADLLIVTGIYSSGETPREGVSGRLIVDAVQAGSEPPPIIYHEDRTTLAQAVADMLAPGDLCLTLGAGDSVTLADEIQAILGGS